MANERARQLRSNMTEAEKALWQRLRALRTLRSMRHHFRRQVPMGSYIVDFCCHRAKLVIEVDGGQHASSENMKHDANRTAWLESQKYRVMRFWNNDVMNNLDGVMDVILTALTAHPTPTPPHRGEGLSRRSPVSPPTSWAGHQEEGLSRRSPLSPPTLWGGDQGEGGKHNALSRSPAGTADVLQPPDQGEGLSRFSPLSPPTLWGGDRGEGGKHNAMSLTPAGTADVLKHPHRVRGSQHPRPRTSLTSDNG